MADEKSANKSKANKYINDSKRVVREESSLAATLTLYLVVAVVLFGLIWAYFANVEEVTRGQGKVIASSRLQNIEHLEGGIVKKINVEEGQKVKAGDVLIVLDETRFVSEHAENLTKVAVYDAEIARLQAEAVGAEKMIFPKGFEQKHSMLVKQAEQQFNADKDSLASSLAIIHKSYQLLDRELKIIKPLVQQGVMSKIDQIRLERQLNDLKGQAHEKSEKVRTDAQSQLSKIKSERRVLIERLATSRDRINRSKIRSPVDGIINKLYVSTIGEVVAPGSKVIDLVPVGGQLSILAYMKPADIGFIHPGQKAMIKVSAYDFSIYGGLQAEVKTIGADSITDQKGNSFYEVVLEAKNNYIKGRGKNLVIIPGMTVTVDIITGEKTVMDYILKPFVKAKYTALRER